MPDGSRSPDPASPTPAEIERFAGVYRRSCAFVWRVLRRFGVPEADLDDALQETFIVAHRRLAEFEGRASERTWLYAIAMRVASSWRRGLRREYARRERAGADLHGPRTGDPETEVARSQASRLVDALLQELDEDKRAVFVLAELEGVAVPEISRMLDVNVHTVHSRLRLARQRFGSALARHDARELGRQRRSPLRTRELAAATRDERLSPTARRAAWAAIAMRLEQGATPLLPGWQALSLGAPAASWVSPAWIATFGVLAAGGIAAVTIDPLARPTTRPTRDAADPSAILEPATPDRSGEPVIPDVEAPPIAPSMEPPVAAPRSKPRRPSETPPAAVDPVDEVNLRRETQLLEAARSALRRNDAEAALAALDRHRAEFPSGLLANERESSRIKALCLAGRRDEARTLVRQATARDGLAMWQAVLDNACD